VSVGGGIIIIIGFAALVLLGQSA